MYAEAASKHGAATNKGNASAANRNYDKIMKVYAELARRGSGDLLRLSSLLASDDDAVRAWAAAHLLKIAPEAAEPVLERVAEKRGLVPFSARMTLDQWRKGKLHLSE